MPKGMRWPLLLGVVLVAMFAWRLRGPHRALSSADVVRVEVQPKGAQQAQTLAPEEAGRLMSWFNQAGQIVDNSHHGAPGCGAHTALMFHLKSGDVVTVYSYMRVTRGKPLSALDDLADDYYFQQPDLQQYLRDWDAKAAAGGC